MDLSTPETVKITIYGGVVDPAYTRLLMQKTDLALMDILALDRAQKKLPIPDAAISRLRHAYLIEGRKPNLHVSAAIAAATGGKAEYIRTRAQGDTHYAKLITDYPHKFGSVNRKDINTLLWKTLSEALTEEQKDRKIGNLLSNLRRGGRIRNTGTRGQPTWTLTERMQKGCRTTHPNTSTSGPEQYVACNAKIR